MAVNINEEGEAVVRVQTLNIRAERVNAGTGGSLAAGCGTGRVTETGAEKRRDLRLNLP